MSLFRLAQLCAVALIVSGCRTTTPPRKSAAPAPLRAETASAPSTPAPQPGAAAAANQAVPVTLASAAEPLPEVIAAGKHHARFDEVPPDGFVLADELVLDELIEGVLARNQSLQAMVAAWRSAAQRYPQAVSLEDPMFESALGPGSIGSAEVSTGYILGGSQKLPWFGKRRLRGQQASAEAGAAFMDVGDARLQLIQATRVAFYEYYLAERQSELNAENVHNLRAFRADALKRYEAALVTQQDVLQADVELALLDRRQVELDRNRAVAAARINTLLNRTPDYPLPPPPPRLPPVEDLPSDDALRMMAVANRPDLASLAARIRAERASLELAYKDYLPDFDVMGRYDAFWQEQPLRAMIGLNANIPIYRRRLDAAAREAMFRLSQRQAEYRQRISDIDREVQTAYEQLQAVKQLVELYQQRIVPAAEQNVGSARAEYIGGRVDFLRLIEAERQLIALLEEEQDLVANYHALRAELERVVAAPLPGIR